MHHTNSTAVTDWSLRRLTLALTLTLTQTLTLTLTLPLTVTLTRTLRRPGASLHLLQRYTTQYWLVLACVAAGVAYPPRLGLGLGLG